MKAITGLLGALAEPTRLRLLRLIYRQELCVCELMDAARLPQYKVSRHLLELRRIGLVEATRSGRWMHYRISRAATRSPLAQDLLKLLDVHLRDLPDTKRDDARLAKRLAAGRADRYACS
jgi:ArsR family transcriptional regulator, arsenate/arsenite/antimonite-responsive transcriptional repressor